MNSLLEPNHYSLCIPCSCKLPFQTKHTVGTTHISASCSRKETSVSLKYESSNEHMLSEKFFELSQGSDIVTWWAATEMNATHYGIE